LSLVVASAEMTGSLAIRSVFGQALSRGSFDVAMFAMGAAFMLLETRGVTTLSLLFGSTWIVNAVVISGILTTVLLANLAVVRFRPVRELPWFAPLLLSLGVLAVFDVAWLNGFSLPVRAVLGGILVGVPIGLAGLIVSMRLGRATHTKAALGSNLLGAVLGGCVEYLCMAFGLQALVGLAAAFYLVALRSTLSGRADAAPPRTSATSRS
jgi:hypothetical protein